MQFAHRAPAPGHVSEQPLMTICVGEKEVVCRGLPVGDLVGHEFSVDFSEHGDVAIVTLPAATNAGVPRFEVLNARDQHPPHVFDLGTSDHCGTGLLIERLAFVETNDCEGNGSAFFYDLHGTKVGPISDRPDFNSYGSWPVDLSKDAWAVVAPAEYSVLIFGAQMRRDVVDLVPIQAESTPTPSFVEAHAKDGTWLIASPTGGVAIIDPTRGVLANAWIVPRCEASP
jgi:hypothetical protein